MPDLQATIREAIRVERHRAGLSQEGLGERIGMTAQVVYTIESGTRVVAVWEMPRICRALGVTLVELLRDADPEDLEALGL